MTSCFFRQFAIPLHVQFHSSGSTARCHTSPDGGIGRRVGLKHQGFLILAGCTKGVLFREKSQRKVKNPAKFCVWLQGLRTQNDRANLPVPAPSPTSNRTGSAKSLHLLHSYISTHIDTSLPVCYDSTLRSCNDQCPLGFLSVFRSAAGFQLLADITSRPRV